MYVSKYVYMMLHICVCICMYMCRYMCMYMFTYMYIYIRIHIHIYIYIDVPLLTSYMRILDSFGISNKTDHGSCEKVCNKEPSCRNIGFFCKT